MADLSLVRDPVEFQRGDIVRVVGQELHWTVLYARGAMKLARVDCPAQVTAWNDVHGRQDFPPEVLERVQ